jgi:hypothetical protein
VAGHLELAPTKDIAPEELLRLCQSAGLRLPILPVLRRRAEPDEGAIHWQCGGTQPRAYADALLIQSVYEPAVVVGVAIQAASDRFVS